MTEQEVQDINEEVADIAGAIVKLAELGEALQSGRLKQRAIVLLLHDISKVRKSDIEYVLNSLPHLKDYVRDLPQ